MLLYIYSIFSDEAFHFLALLHVSHSTCFAFRSMCREARGVRNKPF